MRSFSNGEELRDYLQHAKAGAVVLYHGAVHEVIDAGPIQGMRIAAIPRKDNVLTCPHDCRHYSYACHERPCEEADHE